jgi:hypothetical protein
MSDEKPTNPFYDPIKVNDGRPMSPAKLAERWDCSSSLVTALCVQGKLRHFRIGKMYRIPADAVIEYEIGHYGSAQLSPETIKNVEGSPEGRLMAARDAKQHADQQSKISREHVKRAIRTVRWEARMRARESK